MGLRMYCFLMVFILFSSESIYGKSIHNKSESVDIAELKQAVLDLSAELKLLNESLGKENKHVMFYAATRISRNLNTDTLLVFERVIVNLGNQYDPYDGVFVAPVRGTYMFSWTVSGSGTNYIVGELVVEEKVITATEEHNGGGSYPSGSMTALCHLEGGDHAWIRTTGITSKQYLHSTNDYPQSAFMGLLLLEN